MIKTQLIAIQTILRREIIRLFRIWPQTFLPPVITQGLYFLIFGTFIGSQIRPINGVSYMAYIVPGIIMMSMITASYMNVVFSFFGAKFQRHIEELLVAPVSYYTILSGYVLGGVIRAFITGSMVFIVSFIFIRPTIEHPFIVLLFGLLTAIVFALGGFLNALYAKTFDDANIFTTFVLTPLTYLGGVFYSLDMLPPFFKTLSYGNPIVYMVDGFRYGFYGFSQANPVNGIIFLIVVIGLLAGTNLYLLKKGTGIRS
ncbi:MAG: ABC transporter permease [Candidatus Magasanikbacteria bacterium]|nr:ABC transporter permease [Candidatus Magasanikbacteria bacterium]MCA9391310.1 ABC transporter permease [Candidatus Magasanikbacteria bacterium]